MYYKFKKNDLNDLFNIKDIDLNVNKLIIQKYMNEGNVFKKESDDLKTEQEKKIAYLIINHDEICLDFSNSTTVENKVHLFAALMSDASEITIKITEYSLQKEFKNKYKIEEFNFREINNLSINEDFLIGLTKDGWDNKDFILKKLDSYNQSSSGEQSNIQLAIELVSYIPEEQWLDEDFIDKFINNDNIDKIIENALYKEKNKTLNILYNEKVLDKIIDSENQILLKKYLEIYSEWNSEKDKDKGYNEILLKKEKSFMQYMAKFFTDLEKSKKIIKIINEDYFVLFSMDLRKNKEFKEEYIKLVLAGLEKKVKNSYSTIWNFIKLVGVDAFSDKRIQEFAIKNGNRICGEEHHPLLAGEIIKNNPEEIAKIISVGKGVDFIWDYLSTEQKQEKNIVKEMIKKNPKIYNKLIEPLRLEKEIFKCYYTQLNEHDLLKNFKVGKINKEFFESFSEEELIDLITVVPDFLLEEKFPQHYLDNMTVMAHSNINFHVFNNLYKENERAKETLNKIFENKELSIIMLKNQSSVFTYLAENLKSNMEVLEQYVKKSYQYDNLPAKVYVNKNLLLDIIKGNFNLTEKVPQEFFHDQDFLLRIFEKIDKKELNEQILHSLPTVINEILNTTPLKVGDYYQFFSKTFTNMNLTKKLEPCKNLQIKKTKI